MLVDDVLPQIRMPRLAVGSRPRAFGSLPDERGEPMAPSGFDLRPLTVVRLLS